MTVTNQLCHGPPNHLLLIWWPYVTLSLPDVLTSESGGHLDIQAAQLSTFFIHFPLYALILKIFEIWPNLFILVSHHISFSTLKDLVLTSFYPSLKTFLRLPSSI